VKYREADSDSDEDGKDRAVADSVAKERQRTGRSEKCHERGRETDRRKSPSMRAESLSGLV
jgi:hypothetical protein